MQMFGRKQLLVFHSPFNVAECIRRLESSVDKEGVWVGLTGSKAILGQVRGDEFTLRKRLRYRNSFNPIFYGNLNPEGNGTRITGYFGLHPLIPLTMFLWFAGVLFYGFVLRRGYFPPAIIIILLAGGVVVMALGMWFGRREEKPVLDFIQGTLEAREITGVGV